MRLRRIAEAFFPVFSTSSVTRNHLKQLGFTVQIEGLRAFAQSLSNAGLGGGALLPCCPLLSYGCTFTKNNKANNYTDGEYNANGKSISECCEDWPPSAIYAVPSCFPKIKRYPRNDDQGNHHNGNIKALQCGGTSRARLRTHEEPNCGNQKSCKQYGSDNHVCA